MGREWSAEEIASLAADLVRKFEEMKSFSGIYVHTGKHRYSLRFIDKRFVVVRSEVGSKRWLTRLSKSDVQRLRRVEGGKRFVSVARTACRISEAMEKLKQLNVDVTSPETAAEDVIRAFRVVKRYSEHLNRIAFYVNRKYMSPVGGRLKLWRERDRFGVSRLCWVRRDSGKPLSRRELANFRETFYVISQATGRFFDRVNAVIYNLRRKRLKAKKRALEIRKILLRIRGELE